MKNCSNCGNVLEDNETQCKKCGNYTETSPTQNIILKQPRVSALGIVAFVLSIIGFLTGFIVIGIFFDAIAIILAIISLLLSRIRKYRNGLSIAALILSIISLVLVFSINTPNFYGKNSKVGKTYTSNGIEFTLNYVEFTDAMDNWGGANDNYWKPLPEDAVSHQLEHAVSAKSEDDTICIVSYTAKNISKADKTINDKGTLNFDKGYTYSDGGLSYRVSPTGVWSDIPNGIVLEKLKEDSYEFRAYIIIPQKAVTETDKPLTYTLLGREFNLR